MIFNEQQGSVLDAMRRRQGLAVSRIPEQSVNLFASSYYKLYDPNVFYKYEKGNFHLARRPDSGMSRYNCIISYMQEKMVPFQP